MATVLAVPHQLQGKGFAGYFEDPHYEDWLEHQIRGEVDCIFEEASGRSPSTARELADKYLKRYRDIDPTPEERKKYSIGPTGDGVGIAPAHSRSLIEWAFPEPNARREEIWVERVKQGNFQKGLAICGLCHGLSFAFRLIDAGIRVEETYSYVPLYTQ